MSNLMNSILFNTDSYKCSMWKQYPPGTEYVFSYIEARGKDDTLFFGLQSFIKNYLSQRITAEDVELANKFWTAHGEPFNYDGWMYIVNKKRGRLPLEIRAPKEGSIIPSKNALVTIVNTDPKCYWLPTWVEGALLKGVWYPTSVASVSKRIKNVLKEYLEKSGDVAGLPFKLHDFGLRGCSSNETASLGAAGHLINFMGTDTAVGILRIAQDYGGEFGTIGFSIPASEHSTITSWGRENEQDAYENMIKQFSKPGSVFAIVSDSYNIYKACKMYGDELKDLIISSGGTLVVRPDSGDPIEVLPGMVAILGKYFGFTENEKGYAVLNNVRIIWGDGINQQSITSILQHMVDYLGWSADNFAFGMGGALLGAPQRDDNGWAMKCSEILLREEVDVEGRTVLVQRDVFKDPITDSGKKSKKGRLDLERNVYNGEYRTIDLNQGEVTIDGPWESAMDIVFSDGQLIREQTIVEIRSISNS